MALQQAVDAFSTARYNAKIHYWRDKQGRELDFVLPAGRDGVDVVECKWQPDAFDADALRVFRASYPRGRNFVVSPTPAPAQRRRVARLEVTFGSPSALRSAPAEVA